MTHPIYVQYFLNACPQLSTQSNNDATHEYEITFELLHDEFQQPNIRIFYEKELLVPFESCTNYCEQKMLQKSTQDFESIAASSHAQLQSRDLTISSLQETIRLQNEMISNLSKMTKIQPTQLRNHLDVEKELLNNHTENNNKEIVQQHHKSMKILYAKTKPKVVFGPHGKLEKQCIYIFEKAYGLSGRKKIEHETWIQKCVNRYKCSIRAVQQLLYGYVSNFHFFFFLCYFFLNFFFKILFCFFF